MAVNGTRWLWVAVAIAVLLLPVFPIPAWVGADDPGPVWDAHVVSWALGLMMVTAAALAVGRLAVCVRMPKLNPVKVTDWAIVGPLAVVVTGVAVFVVHGVFAANPHWVDEMTQLFQARTYLAGRLAAPTPDRPEFFLFMHSWITPAGWVSQYPPGHALLLAVGMFFGAEWLINPLLGGVSLVLLYLLARGLYGRKLALMAAFLWATSAWVIFMSATYMNHTSTVTFALAAWAALWAPRNPNWRHFTVAGVMFGMVAATRPLDALAVAIPAATWILTRRRWEAVPWLALGGTPILIAFGYVNWRLFGHPLRLGYSVLYGVEHQLGFHTDVWGFSYTPWIALSNMTSAIRRLHIYLFEWPIPALLPLGVWALLARHRHPSDMIVALGLIAGPVLYLFYWHSGFYPGPRFYYVAAPYLVIGTARACLWGWVRVKRMPTRFVRWDTAYVAAGIIILLWAAVGLFPARVANYRSGLSSFKQHPERQLRDAGVRQALVLVPESWGARTIVDLWALGATPGLVERAYRNLDACDLHHLVVESRADLATGTDVSGRLENMLLKSTEPAPLRLDWADPTLRLRQRERLSEDCIQQLDRDRRGFALYGNLAWRNEIGLASGIVFARDLNDRNEALLGNYPGWEIWRWAPPNGQPESDPVLTLVQSASSQEPP